jgi:ATP-dependent protease ClpP protease subunit
MNEVLLYGPIWYQSSIDFINAINAVEGDSLTVRVNTGGGEVSYGYGMIAKFKEFEGAKNVKIDGTAYSMGAIFAVYADDVEALDVSKFMFHRAAMSPWYEDEYMTDAERDHLTMINADFEKAFRAKVDVKKFEELKGVKVKDLFSMDTRIDVFLSASEAKQIGLVSRIVNITPKKQTAIKNEMAKIAASYGMEAMSMTLEHNEPSNDGLNPNKKVISKTNINMTIEQLKADHPELFAQAVAMGCADERDRVGAWMKFVNADADAVAKGIESGKNIGQTEMADFTVKMISAQTLNKVSAEGAETKVETVIVPGATTNEKVESTAADNLKSTVMAGLGLTSEIK